MQQRCGILVYTFKKVDFLCSIFIGILKLLCNQEERRVGASGQVQPLNGYSSVFLVVLLYRTMTVVWFCACHDVMLSQARFCCLSSFRPDPLSGERFCVSSQDLTSTSHVATAAISWADFRRNYAAVERGRRCSSTDRLRYCFLLQPQLLRHSLQASPSRKATPQGTHPFSHIRSHTRLSWFIIIMHAVWLEALMPRAEIMFFPLAVSPGFGFSRVWEVSTSALVRISMPGPS